MIELVCSISFLIFLLLSILFHFILFVWAVVVVGIILHEGHRHCNNVGHMWSYFPIAAKHERLESQWTMMLAWQDRIHIQRKYRRIFSKTCKQVSRSSWYVSVCWDSSSGSPRNVTKRGTTVFRCRPRRYPTTREIVPTVWIRVRTLVASAA